MRSTVPLGVSPDRSTRARWTLPLLLLAVLGLVVPGLVAPATAYAADDPGIKVEVTRLVSTDSDGVAESDNQLTKWYTAKVIGTWDATSLPAITAGTSFTVGLPDVFTFRQYPRTDPMTVRDEGGVERTVGECVTTKSEMTCTFNEEAARLSAAGFKNFKGGFSLMLTAVNTTDQETAKFNLNGQVRDIDLPGTGGIAPELFKPAALTKWTQEVIKVGQTENLWVVYWGNNYLRDRVEPEGTIKTDGSVSTLEIHETLAPGQEFNWDRPADVRLAFNQSAADSGLFQVVWTMDGSTQHPDWSVEVIKNSPSDVTFKVTGPFPADTNMALYLPVKFTEPAKPGVKYSNTVKIEGLASKATVSAYYVDSVEITVTMEPGYGTFKVSKLVEGDGAALLDSNVQFPLQVDFTLPAHYNTYNPVWQPPAGFTMDADGLNGHGTIMIAPGKTTYFDPQVTLPAGTTVTLSEDPNGAQPAAPSTVQWGAPEFSQNSFVIGDQRTTAVQVTNKTTYVPAPPAVSVGDYVWEDVNRDGLQDDTDKPIENVELAISRTDGAQVNNADGTPRGALTTTTDASGKYVFDNLEVLPAGTHYVVSVNAGTVPAGLLATTDNAGDREKDSSAQAGKAESVDLTTDGASDMTLDFGYVRPAVSVGDYVWEDVNKDGLQDDTDKPIEGVTLTISRSDGAPVNNADGSARTELTTQTGPDGKYVFELLEVLPAGVHYVVTVTAPEGFLPTVDNAGDRAVDSSAKAGMAESVDLTDDGASDMTLDFGYVRPEPPVTATPSPKPGKPLAKTGASILVPLMLAGAALGGGSLLVARRRRNG